MELTVEQKQEIAIAATFGEQIELLNKWGLNPLGIWSSSFVNGCRKAAKIKNQPTERKTMENIIAELQELIAHWDSDKKTCFQFAEEVKRLFEADGWNKPAN